MPWEHRTEDDEVTDDQHRHLPALPLLELLKEHPGLQHQVLMSAGARGLGAGGNRSAQPRQDPSPPRTTHRLQPQAERQRLRQDSTYSLLFTFLININMRLVKTRSYQAINLSWHDNFS